MKYLPILLTLVSMTAGAQISVNGSLVPPYCPYRSYTNGMCKKQGSPLAADVTVPGAPDVDRGWHVLIIRRGGNVQLMKGLTQEEAQFTSNRLLGLPATKAEKRKAAAEDKARRERQRAEERHQAELDKILPMCPAKDGFVPGGRCRERNGDILILGSPTSGSFISGSESPDDVMSAEVFR